MLRKWEGTLREAFLGEWTEGAEPCKVKALSTVLNGGREETCRKVTRLAPTHQGVGNRPFYRTFRTPLEPLDSIFAIF